MHCRAPEQRVIEEVASASPENDARAAASALQQQGIDASNSQLQTSPGAEEAKPNDASAGSF